MQAKAAQPLFDQQKKSYQKPQYNSSTFPDCDDTTTKAIVKYEQLFLNRDERIGIENCRKMIFQRPETARLHQK